MHRPRTVPDFVDCKPRIVIILPCYRERSHSWSSARDWKSRFEKSIVGSNPTLSAREPRQLIQLLKFLLIPFSPAITNQGEKGV